ncbi:MarR family transcriptional regulator [Streptomyces sp. NBC_00178]|uniref:MarR family winged helix-turn-helix transcriptional regulator n=1 Tax=Streptomyces sp. NBC_00178 TaxID=2975672 RepID=UPI002E2C180C|nr:MarR family transcriptional regulator [Streptomyces sp. NBC_00178]
MRQSASPGAERDTPDPQGSGRPGPSPLTTPPSVLGLNAYLMYATGKAARRRLTERLSAHGLRLWHLTILAMPEDAGRVSKGDLASRLDMNQSDLTRTVTDLERAGHVRCARDPSDRRRIEVTLTPAGRSTLTALNADVAAAESELLAPLDADDRERFALLLRRVHAHLEHDRAGTPSDVVPRAPASPRNG